MSKIIEKFKSDPTPENAINVLRYAKKHPMCECFYYGEIEQARIIWERDQEIAA